MPVDIDALAATLTAERVESKKEHDQLREIIRRVKSESEESRLAAARARLANIELQKKVVELEGDIEGWKRKCAIMEETLKAAKVEKEAKQQQWDLLAVEVQKEIVGARQKYEEVMKIGLQKLVEAEDILRTRELGISDPLSLVARPSTTFTSTATPPPATEPTPSAPNADVGSPAHCERCARRAAKKAAAAERHSAEEKLITVSYLSRDYRKPHLYLATESVGSLHRYHRLPSHLPRRAPAISQGQARQRLALLSRIRAKGPSRPPEERQLEVES